MKSVLATALSFIFLYAAPCHATEDAQHVPNIDQLNIQVEILKDQVKTLNSANEEYRKRSELIDQKITDAYIDLKRKEFDYYSHLMEVNVGIFHIQKIASYVVLLLVFMVVSAGVLFSGFQLWKSVSIAGVQTTNDLEISAAKVRVTSSVVGIVVLAISLAFLFIYTREVYAIKSLPSIKPPNSSVEHP